jgi:hypothetical protein
MLGKPGVQRGQGEPPSGVGSGPSRLAQVWCPTFESSHSLPEAATPDTVLIRATAGRSTDRGISLVHGIALLGAKDHRMDVAAWLRGLGLEQYATAFLGNDVDGEVLPELTADDLISCRRLRLAGDQRLRGHARGQHDRDDAGLRRGYARCRAPRPGGARLGLRAGRRPWRSQRPCICPATRRRRSAPGKYRLAAA